MRIFILGCWAVHRSYVLEAFEPDIYKPTQITAPQPGFETLPPTHQPPTTPHPQASQKSDVDFSFGSAGFDLALDLLVGGDLWQGCHLILKVTSGRAPSAHDTVYIKS